MKSTRNDDFEYDLHVISLARPTSLLAPPNHLLAPQTEPRALLNHLLAPPTHPWNNTSLSKIRDLKPEIGVSSSGDATGIASDSHTSASHITCLSNALFMLATFNLEISTDRQRRIEISCCWRTRLLFADTSHSAAMLRKWANTVFYS